MTTDEVRPRAVADSPSIIPCRLCGADAAYKFTTKLIAKYDVRYFVCSGCGSLETEPPFWLDEAYSLNLGDLDCGSAQRNLHNFAACLAIARIWGINSAVDFGGGDGLLTRLLRDRHLDCYVEDKYGSPTYAQQFSTPPERTDAIFAFEVLEHFVDPKAELGALFARKPKVLFGTTSRFTGQGADWWYLSRRSGHHVFFYTSAAMHHIAASHGYRVIETGAFFLFVESASYSAAKASLSKIALSGLARRTVMAVCSFIPATGIGKDTALIRAGQPPEGPAAP